MKVTVNGRNVEVTAALKKYAKEKIGKFDKYAAGITEASVTLSVQKYMHKVEVILKAKKHQIQAEAVTEELYSAIDEVVDKLDKQVKKLKGKLTDHRKGESKEKQMPVVTAAELAEPGTIIQRQTYAAKPMPPEEAAAQLSMGELNFFVFTNAETGDLNVIYKRNDGNYGLFEPKAR